jgi:hypothetical protein
LAEGGGEREPKEIRCSQDFFKKYAFMCDILDAVSGGLKKITTNGINGENYIYAIGRLLLP